MVGCSLSSGYKMDPDTRKIDRCCPTHPALWINRLLTDAGYDDIHNCSSAGANNDTIFFTAVERLAQERYDLVTIQWTLLNRMNFTVGLESFSTRTLLENNQNVSVNPYKIISGKWLDDLGDRLRYILNPHWSILRLVQYVNILRELQINRQGKIVFVNGVVHLPCDYFQRSCYNKPSDLPEMTQHMLNMTTRDDDEVLKLYTMIHDQYDANGGIRPESWMNLYQPLLPMKVDTIEPDDSHPGWQSQEVFYDFLQGKRHML